MARDAAGCLAGVVEKLCGVTEAAAKPKLPGPGDRLPEAAAPEVAPPAAVQTQANKVELAETAEEHSCGEEATHQEEEYEPPAEEEHAVVTNGSSQQKAPVSPVSVVVVDECEEASEEELEFVHRSPTKRASGILQTEDESIPLAPLREDPASRPFFNRVWPGVRNDYAGEVGYCFVAEVPCEVTALGRPADPPLMESAIVTLWSVECEECMANAVVGPSSRVEGQFAWEPLSEAILLKAGKEYRLTQRCRANMLDRWCDSKAEKEEVPVQTWASLARFKGGCCRNIAGFPNRLDGDLRRPGIVNFKAMLGPPTEPELTAVSKEQFARQLAKEMARETKLTGGTIEEVEARLAALAGLLALMVDELASVSTGASALAILAPEEELRRIAASASAVAPSSKLELEGCGIFDARRLVRSMSRAARSSSLRDCGLLLVGARTGEVHGLCLRPRAAGSGANVEGGGSISFDDNARGRPLAAWELAAKLEKGMAFARNLAGDVCAFQADEVRRANRGLMLSETDGGGDMEIPEASWSVQL
eukprot:TRINITY_DN27053_c0_g1_i1.p1 TRINITY_DN27053_c0_g1~~TRINITY_DN27053_c0_g1_i1.p1  ORF type:complete len:535 (+),score=129.89 TRINITY_DN27053_c0_g1_i1:47-1651(+)